MIQRSILYLFRNLLLIKKITILGSFNFAKEITTYDSSLHMTRLDIQLLFANSPLNETINICVSDLRNENLYNEKFSKRDLF